MKRSKYIEPEYREFIKELESIGYGKYQALSLFEDFLLMTMVAIKNRYDYSQEDEDMYLKIINKYNKEEQEKFAYLLAKLIEMYYLQYDEGKDILGEIYEKMSSGNRILGQFFTPIHIANFMGEINDGQETLEEMEYITVNDPACGSGVLLIGFRNENYKYKNKIVYFARDIDLRCVCMTFIQFTMYQMPARIVWGNSLLHEERKVLYTPEFVKNNWFDKLRKGGKYE